VLSCTWLHDGEGDAPRPVLSGHGAGGRWTRRWCRRQGQGNEDKLSRFRAATCIRAGLGADGAWGSHDIRASEGAWPATTHGKLGERSRCFPREWCRQIPWRVRRRRGQQTPGPRCGWRRNAGRGIYLDFACTLVNIMGREGAFDCNSKRRDDAAGGEAAPDMEGRKGARGKGAI